MEENRRKRTPKKPEHPVREWISDNLRYFMLIGGVVAIIVIALLVIKLVSATTGSADAKAETTAESTEIAVPEDVSNKDHLIVKSESEPEVTVTPEAEPEEPEADMTKEVDSSMLTTLVKDYFEGLALRDPEKVRACVDVLSDEDYQQVLNNVQITSYNDVEVYTCDGLDEKSRVAFVSYKYTLADVDVAVPALTEFYIYEISEGDWRLASDTSDEKIENRIQELAKTDAVQAMIDKVQKEYDQFLAEHPELA